MKKVRGQSIITQAIKKGGDLELTIQKDGQIEVLIFRYGKLEELLEELEHKSGSHRIRMIEHKDREKIEEEEKENFE